MILPRLFGILKRPEVQAYIQQGSIMALLLLKLWSYNLGETDNDYRLWFLADGIAWVLVGLLLRWSSGNYFNLPAILFHGCAWFNLWHEIVADGAKTMWLQYVLAGGFVVFETLRYFICRRRKPDVRYYSRRMRKITYHQSAN